jgi:hypothetical protein
MPFVAGHGLDGAWELDQSQILPAQAHPRLITKQALHTVVFHGDWCPCDVHFIIPVQPESRTLVYQTRHLGDRTATRDYVIDVRVCGADFRKVQPQYKTVRACMWLSVMLQQYLHVPLVLSTHSAFELAYSRGSANECPGHKFFLALRRIRDAGISCQPFIK